MQRFIPVVPGPSSSPSIQKGAKQSWYGIAGVSAPPAKTAKEAVQQDPRKKPIDKKLKG
jgi:hypothetical protein